MRKNSKLFLFTIIILGLFLFKVTLPVTAKEHYLVKECVIKRAGLIYETSTMDQLVTKISNSHNLYTIIVVTSLSLLTTFIVLKKRNDYQNLYE